MNKRNIQLPKFLSILAAILMLSGCDNILPDQYQPLEIEDVPEIDAMAYEILTLDTLVHSANTILINSLVSSIWSDTTDSVIIAENFDSLRILLDTVYTDTPMKIFQTTEEGSGFVFFSAEESGILYLYTTWYLTALNLNTYISFDFFDEQGIISPNLPTTLALETFEKYSTIVIDVTGGTESRHPICEIRSKAKYEITQGTYLMRVNVSDPTQFPHFRLAMLFE